MKKLPICKICKKRKIHKQQEWKIEEEKTVCFTCNTFKNFCHQLGHSLQLEANNREINREVYIILKEETRGDIEIMIENMGGGEKKVRVIDKKVEDKKVLYPLTEKGESLFL